MTYDPVSEKDASLWYRINLLRTEANEHGNDVVRLKSLVNGKTKEQDSPKSDSVWIWINVLCCIVDTVPYVCCYEDVYLNNAEFSTNILCKNGWLFNADISVNRKMNWKRLLRSPINDY